MYINEEERYKKDLQRIQNFRLLDDDFMSKCFENNIECTELILHIVLGKEDLYVENVRTQYAISNLQGRSVRLDIYATDTSGKKYNIEIQRADHGAGSKRARYNSSIMDANVLKSGEDFSKLPETYVIFITENDVIGENLPIYHIDRRISETGKYFADGSHIIYVNAQYKDDTPLGILMHDFACSNPDDIIYPVLANRVKYFKQNKEGIEIMCKAMEEMRNEAKLEERIEFASTLIKLGKLTYEEISKASKLSIEEIEKIAQKEEV